MIDQALQVAIRRSWSARTAPDENPAAGHCDVTSLFVRETVGGDLKVAQVFRNGELSEHHFWNVPPDETEMDLTSCQFDGAERLGGETAGSILLRCGGSDEC